MIRAASHSGTWYSSDPEILIRQIQEWFSSIPSSAYTRLIGIVSPHAGLRYSGYTASFGYKRLYDSITNKHQRIVILAPSHRFFLRNCAVTQSQVYETPIGNLKIDTDCVDMMLSSGLFSSLPLDEDQDEHSVEMQLPFLAYILKTKGLLDSVKIVPVLVGETDNDVYGKFFAENIYAESTIFVVSSDFCHYGSRFDYWPFKDDPNAFEKIENLDMQGVNLLQQKDYSGFKRYLKETGNTICGRNPLLLLLKMISFIPDVSLNLLHYEQSSKVKSIYDSSVSYVSMSIN